MFIVFYYAVFWMREGKGRILKRALPEKASFLS